VKERLLYVPSQQGIPRKKPRRLFARSSHKGLLDVAIDPEQSVTLEVRALPGDAAPFD